MGKIHGKMTGGGSNQDNSIAHPVTATAADGYNNYIAALGAGADSMTARGGYKFQFVTLDRNQLEAIYRTSWIAGAAVDYIADDMTRAGIDINGGVDPDEAAYINDAIDDMHIWEAIRDLIKWGRLYGGAVSVLLLDGQDYSTPLKIDATRRGQFKGLLTLDRWQVMPDMESVVREIGPHLGEPEYYTVIPDGRVGIEGKIHYTRVIRHDPIKLPYYQRLTNNYWGESIIERMYDRLIAYDSATLGASELTFKCYLRTLKVQNLDSMIATGGKSYDAFIKSVQAMRSVQSNQGLSVIDAKNDLEAQTYNFAGLDSILGHFAEQVSGAIEIPLVRLLGQSPSGLSGSGEGDLRNYYDSIAKRQNTMLRHGLGIILGLVYRSLYGRPPKEPISFVFSSLWNMSQIDLAKVAETDAKTIAGVYSAGLIGAGTALKELKQMSEVSGRFTNITKEDIDAADELPPPSEVAGDPDGDEGSGKDVDEEMNKKGKE